MSKLLANSALMQTASESCTNCSLSNFKSGYSRKCDKDQTSAAPGTVAGKQGLEDAVLFCSQSCTVINFHVCGEAIVAACRRSPDLLALGLCSGTQHPVALSLSDWGIGAEGVLPSNASLVG
jgi:hypothetical protein